MGNAAISVGNVTVGKAGVTVGKAAINVGNVTVGKACVEVGEAVVHVLTESFCIDVAIDVGNKRGVGVSSRRLRPGGQC